MDKTWTHMATAKVMPYTIKLRADYKETSCDISHRSAQVIMQNLSGNILGREI
jgi:hypothetical protein